MKKKLIYVLIAAGLLAVAGLSASQKGSDPAAAVVSAELVDADNNPVDFRSFKGKVVFVNNWASWCPPCVAEMPTIAELRKTVNNPDLVFVMVSYDEKPSKALAFMQKKGYDFPVYFPGEKYPFNTASIPATFLIDRNGNVLGPHVGKADYSDAAFVDRVRTLLAGK